MILDDLLEDKVIFEDHARKLYFDYTKVRQGQEETTQPVVLYLGTWRRTLKSGVRRTYWCGIDMNLLDEEQLAALQFHLPYILKKKRVYDRYWAGKEKLPDVFEPFYRTYNTNSVGSVIKGRLFSLDVTGADEKEATKLADKDGGPEWDELSDDHKSYYIAQAVRKRGTREAEKQEEAAKEKEEKPEEMPKPDEPAAEPVAPAKAQEPLPKDFVPIKPNVPTPRRKPRPEQIPPSTRAARHGMLQPDPKLMKPERPAPLEQEESDE